MRPEHSPLKVGARVALVCTSSPPPIELVERAVRAMTDWGLEPVLGEHVHAGHPRASYLSASDRQRAADLQAVWCDPEIDAVFCMRGGYGAARMLDLLDVEALRAVPAKPIFGSSDVTAVAEFWLERLDCGFWFTPMLATPPMVEDTAATARLHEAIFDPAEGRVLTSSTAESLVRGEATGRLIGGNLSVLAMTIGARGRPILHHEGAIALLEDITEPTYRLDGYLTSLHRAGWFDGVAGIALGSWRDCGPIDEIRALAEEFFAPLGVPVVWELGFGHGPGAHSIPLGATATLFADDEPRILIQGD